MKKKMEVASPFHLHTVINDEIRQKDHGYVTPMTNTCARQPSTGSVSQTQTALSFFCAPEREAWGSISQLLIPASYLIQTGTHKMTCR